MKLRFLGPLALLLLACGGGAPEVEEAVVDATPPTVASADRPRKPRPTTQPDGGVDVSSTFPNGLDWVREPPPERTPKSASEARPSAGNEGRPLALKLAEAVLATHTKLVADGPTVVMRVGESSQIELAITLQPGHCYGAYAAGGDGVFELDVVFGLDPGTGAALAMLAASASYIAVPAAVRMALPDADPGIYLSMSLAVTFPFNILVGIPLVLQLGPAVLG